MEQIIKLSLVILIFLTPIGVSAGGTWAPPDDKANLELLILAHKKIAQIERIAIADLTAVKMEHDRTSDFITKCKTARDFLNQRLADVNSILLFTARVVSMGIDMKNMIEEYKEFASLTFDNADKHPFLIAYYASINYKLRIEVELIVKRAAKFPAFQTNILKATMKEKNQILDYIVSSINRIEFMLSRANYRCRLIASVGVKEWNITEFINDRDNKQAIDKLIEQWNIQTGKRG